jgi:2-hydroxychromene-2-carboxylate isomerase
MTTAMKELTFWFDPVSPFAYLAFERLPQALEGLSVDVTYRPMLFAALLKHWDQKGPAEIEPKRAWTFRHVHWLAHRQGTPLATPLQHPFNPLAVLRLLLACAPAGGTPNRFACETVLRHVWQGGADANDADRLAALTRELAPRIAPDDPQIKQALRDATDAAIAQGLFGVPTIEVDGRLFWGLDALPMLADYLRGDPWFATDTWAREGRARGGVMRKS